MVLSQITLNYFNLEIHERKQRVPQEPKMKTLGTFNKSKMTHNRLRDAKTIVQVGKDSVKEIMDYV